MASAYCSLQRVRWLLVQEAKELAQEFAQMTGLSPSPLWAHSWLLSAQGCIFSFYLLCRMMTTPGASAKPLLIPSCLCQRLRSVGSLPAQTSYGRSGRHGTVCVTSHLLCRRQSQVSGHVLRLCQGITFKSIQTRITG